MKSGIPILQWYIARKASILEKHKIASLSVGGQTVRKEKMTYTYSLTFKLGGFLRKEGCGTEEQMFASALELDRLGAEMLSAERETWETKGDYHHLVKIESYNMGKPTHVVWEDFQ